MSLSASSVVSRNDTNFLANPVGEEIIILNMETGNYLGLNQVGAAIWDQLQQKSSVQQIIDHLVENYEVDADTCSAETIDYLEKILALGLLEIES